MRNNLRAYKQVGVESAILSADPHTLVLMMFDGLLKNISNAKGACERKDMQLKAEAIGKAAQIARALKESLDFNSQPEISENLANLYDHCVYRLMELSISMELSGFDTLIDLFKPIRNAWAEMPESAKQEGMRLINERDAAQA